MVGPPDQLADAMGCVRFQTAGLAALVFL